MRMATMITLRVAKGKRIPLPASFSRATVVRRGSSNGILLHRCWRHHRMLVARSCAASMSTISMDQRYISGFRCLNINEFVTSDTQDTPRILAVSPDALTRKEQRLLWRFVRWCREWIESIWEAILVSLRVSEITLKLSPLIILSPAAYLAAAFTDEEKSNPISDLAWKYTLYAIQRLGPGYVKLCQWMATRRDIFPVYVCDRLAQLHDKAYAHPLRQSEEILEEAFGDYKRKGLELEEVVGCGSAAQVYRGKLTTKDHKTGTEKTKPVAIKILHPWFQRQIHNDLWLMDTLAKMLHRLPSETIRMVNLPRSVQNFGTNLRRQADLRLEGDNLRRFRANFYGKYDDESGSKILFPKPMDGWVSSKVLVEDLVEDATPIAEFLKDASEIGLQTRKELAGPLLRAFLKMVFQDNFTHCDLHPGNVLIQTKTVEQHQSANIFSALFSSKTEDKDNQSTETKRRNIVFLDAGIAEALSDNDRRNLKDLFRAVILNNGYEAGRLMVERAKYERCSQREGGVEAFANGVGEIVAEFHDRRKQGLTLGAVRVGSLLSRVLDLCRVHGVEIDPSMASIVISTLVLEGLGRSLEPNLNLMDCAVPFVLGRGKV